MATNGHAVAAQLAASTSPCMRKDRRRFGKYGLNMEALPALLSPKPMHADRSGAELAKEHLETEVA